MSNFAPDDFRPYVTGEEGLGSYIRVGGYVSSPYWNGLWTAAANFNHLLAFSMKPIIEQHGSTDLVYTSPTAVTFAKYVVRIPTLLNRRYLRVEVKGTTSGGTTFTITGSMNGMTPTVGTATASGSTSTIDVEVNKADTYGVLTLSFVMSASATFTLTDVRAYSRPDPTSGGGATLDTIRTAGYRSPGSWYNQNPVYTPQATAATSQYDTNAPLTVAMMHDLTIGLQGMFRDNVAPLVNWSFWESHATLPTANHGLVVANNSNITTPTPVGQYIYYPRLGVKTLNVFMAARTNGYSSVPGKVSYGWRGGATGSITPVPTATTDFTSDAWVVWNQHIAVPEGPGPLYFDVKGKGSTDGSLDIQSVAVYEDFGSVV